MPFLRAALLKKKLAGQADVLPIPAAEIAIEPEEEIKSAIEEVLPTPVVDIAIEPEEIEQASEDVLLTPADEIAPEPEEIEQAIEEVLPIPAVEIAIEPEEIEQASEDILPTPEEEIEQVNIDELHKIIDMRAEESEKENDTEEFTGIDESVHAPEDDGNGADVPAFQEEESPEQETGIAGIVEETSPEIQQEEQALASQPDSSLPQEIADALSEPEPEPEQEAPQSQPQKDYSGSQLDYDFTSGERYVDTVSTKTEFDKMLDELSAISKELLSWQTEKFARDYTEKFQEGDSSVADARKYEAFLGGYITNAAMMLYDKGYRDAAIKQLEQAISILQARKKLEDETLAIKSSVEEHNDTVDLSDILGLFGDG